MSHHNRQIVFCCFFVVITRFLLTLPLVGLNYTASISRLGKPRALIIAVISVVFFSFFLLSSSVEIVVLLRRIPWYCPSNSRP